MCVLCIYIYYYIIDEINTKRLRVCCKIALISFFFFCRQNPCGLWFTSLCSRDSGEMMMTAKWLTYIYMLRSYIQHHHTHIMYIYIWLYCCTATIQYTIRALYVHIYIYIMYRTTAYTYKLYTERGGLLHWPFS